MAEAMRIDKWLWCVRIYKTRSMATDACKNGKVKLNDKLIKASQQIKGGDHISIRKGSLHMEIKVKSLLKNRVGAKLVEAYLEDLTPAEEYEKQIIAKKKSFEYRDRGQGRPTKKERREMDDFKRKV